MKYLLIAFCFISASAFAQKSDTTKTTVLAAFNWINSDYRTVTAFRIVSERERTRDSLVEVRGKDSIFAKVKSSLIDSTYFVSVLDTVRHPDGKPVFVGKKKTAALAPKWVILPKELLLIDYNKNWK